MNLHRRLILSSILLSSSQQSIPVVVVVAFQTTGVRSRSANSFGSIATLSSALVVDDGSGRVLVQPKFNERAKIIRRNRRRQKFIYKPIHYGATDAVEQRAESAMMTEANQLYQEEKRRLHNSLSKLDTSIEATSREDAILCPLLYPMFKKSTWDEYKLWLAKPQGSSTATTRAETRSRDGSRDDRMHIMKLVWNDYEHMVDEVQDMKNEINELKSEVTRLQSRLQIEEMMHHTTHHLAPKAGKGKDDGVNGFGKKSVNELLDKTCFQGISEPERDAADQLNTLLSKEESVIRKAKSDQVFEVSTFKDTEIELRVLDEKAQTYEETIKQLSSLLPSEYHPVDNVDWLQVQDLGSGIK